jgi:tetratricopeptide (TPR) repeat protein
MFYLLSLVAYVKWRLPGHQSTAAQSNNLFRVRSVALYMTSLVSAVLAMKTKQIAFTLPVMIVLYEFLFFSGKVKNRILYLLPVLFTLPIIPLTLLDLEQPIGDVIGDVGEASRDLTQMSRLDYLFTQFRVLVTYLRLIILPINQNLDYDYPVFTTFFNIEVFLSFLLLMTVLCSGMYLLYRSRRSSPHLRITAFGTFWFFITLSVESSFIPIKEIIFEYRVYLPSAGVFMAASILTFTSVERLGGRWRAAGKAAFIILCLIVMVLAGATYARNNVWRDELTLWQDVVNKSPNKSRGYNNLCNAYNDKGLFNEAIEVCLEAVNLDPAHYIAHNNLGNAYKSKELNDKAIEQYQIAIKLNSYYPDSYNNLGNVYQSQDFIDMAIKNYQIAIKLKPDVPEVYNNLGNAYQSKGFIDMAIKYYQIAIKLKPDVPEVYNNLGNAYVSQGLIEKAIEQYLTAIKINRYYPSAFYNLGNAYESKGLINNAIEQYLMAIKLNPYYPEPYINLGNTYVSLGLIDKAIEQYLAAIKIKPDYPEAHHNLGVAYKSKGDTDLAIKSFNNALRLKPGWEPPLKELEQISKERQSIR